LAVGLVETQFRRASRRIQLSRLDPRAPLVVDTRDLGRRPGSIRRLSRTLPAPAGLGVEVIGVPEGSELELELRLESVVEGVLVSGDLRARLEGECARCLDPVASSQEAPLQELFLYPDQDVDDVEALRLEGDLIDLEPVVRDAVVLALPFQPVCRPDCPGLCVVCGVRMADDPAHGHEQADPRWDVLKSTLGAIGPVNQGPVADDEEEES
jgi:uncharacterized protein